MKKLIISLAVLVFSIFASMTWADPPLTFLWDANTETDLAGYRIYFSENPGDYVFGGNTSPNFLAEIPCTANDTTCCTWSKPATQGFYYYVATAFDSNGFESVPSSEVNSLPPGQVKNFKFIK